MKKKNHHYTPMTGNFKPRGVRVEVKDYGNYIIPIYCPNEKKLCYCEVCKPRLLIDMIKDMTKELK